VIRWEGVSVRYNGGFSIGPVDLDAASGEWLALIGPNGAGKSSLLRAAVGGVPHDGVISLGGREYRPGIDIAWMPQRPNLPDEMTVSDYVLLGRTPYLGFFQAEGQRDFEAAASALRRLDLEELAQRKLNTLSGGEAQRAVLARALAQESPVLLLDEPTSSLDLGHAVEVLELIDELRQGRNLTVVTAIHDLTLAERFADRLALISDGEVVAVGRGRDVLTSELLEQHYGGGVAVIDHDGRPTIIPNRRKE
jgi:iron complex transport system ATP-binding protein